MILASTTASPARYSAAQERNQFQPNQAAPLDQVVSDKPMGELHLGKALLKGAIFAGAGALLGAGMESGGVGGFVCGALAGATAGGVTIAPMGNGKGAEGLVYAAAGLAGGAIAGATAGAFGIPHASIALALTLGGVQALRALHD